jgi:phage tail-like protein
MNINTSEISFFVINTETLWKEGEKVESIQVEKQGISLAKYSDYSYMDTHVPGTVIPKSLDRDACGVLYILDEEKKSIMIFEIENQYHRGIECLFFGEPVSIAVSDLNIYVVDGETLYCIARVNGQIRWEREIQTGIDLRIATLEPDRLYVMDIENKKVFKTNRECKLDATTEIALRTQNPADKDEEIFYSLDTKELVDIASDREGCFYILEAQSKEILKFDQTGLLLQVNSIPFKEDVDFKTLAVESSDNIFLGFWDETPGNSREFKPGESSGIVQLSKTIKYAAVGAYTSKVFDSTITGCQWHQVVLDADIPANTRVTLSYAASDYEPAVDGPYTSHPLVNPVDTLITGAVGRYIRFRIELFSDEATGVTPLVKRLKVYFPRITYLRYLPDTYQEDEKNREFLQCFLSLFETFMSCSEEQIFDFTRYLDPLAVPEGFIPWLSSWLAIAYDENWPLTKKRLLIRLAPQLYKKRGTPRVLSQIIELYYDIPPIIIEQFQLECIRNREKSKEEEEKTSEPSCNSTLSMEEIVDRLYGTSPYRFTVVVPPRWEDPKSRVKKAREVTNPERNTLQRIVDMEKPAHTEACLQVLEPWFYLDMHTYLEINTILTRTEFLLEKSSVLGRDTVIRDIEPGGQVVPRSRIGIDLQLT